MLIQSIVNTLRIADKAISGGKFSLFLLLVYHLMGHRVGDSILPKRWWITSALL